MNANQTPKTALAAALLLAAAFAAPCNLARADGPILKSSNLGELDAWYGRAGGTIGTQRIEGLHAAKLPPANVGVAYDKGVAERTNMGRGDVEPQPVGITYDKAVSERTNMSREEQPGASVVTK
jgi:hypothetical protein